jgi:hydroxymethylpyrimidine pyrophosphatase-like HAD family hydrolase
MASIGLIATDLDGTLIGSANELPLYSDFSDRVSRLREHDDAVWAACTGRTFSSFWEFFLPMRRMGILPDYVIVRHAYIFTRTRLGFLPHVAWNFSMLIQLWKEGKAARQAIDHWHQAVTGGAMGVSTIRRQRYRLSLRFDSEESANVSAGMLRDKTQAYSHVQIYTVGRDVDVRLVPSTKGLALSELGRRIGIGREGILAIGNGNNDVSMLDGTVAAMTGCPANSDEPVFHAVHKAEGHIAEHRALRGVIEILDAYVEGVVRSELPTGLDAFRGMPAEVLKQKKTGMPRRHSQSTHPLFFGSITYAGLLVFACFDVIPFSHIIRKPLDLIVTTLARFFS